MQFVPEAYPAEFPIFLKRFISITGWEPWKKRIDSFQSWGESNVFMKQYINECHPLEAEMMRIHNHRKKTGRNPDPTKDARTARLGSFAIMVARLHAILNATGKKKLEGRLRDALKSRIGLSPLALEMKIAAHLMSRDFDVVFHDFEAEEGGFDFLAEKSGLSMEVECKHGSGDIGRQIHLWNLYKFLGQLKKNVRQGISSRREAFLLSLRFLDGCKKKVSRLIVY